MLNAQTTLDTHEETPLFGQGQLAQASVSVNRLLGARWSVLGSYVHTRFRNTGAGLAGNLLPGFARHVLLAQTTWRHDGRDFSLLRLTWRGERRAGVWPWAMASSRRSGAGASPPACKPGCAAATVPPCGHCCVTGIDGARHWHLRGPDSCETRSNLWPHADGVTVYRHRLA